jgi:hypothetical protein
LFLLILQEVREHKILKAIIVNVEWKAQRLTKGTTWFI